MKCSRCKLRGYCSKECQTADWPMHKAPCKMEGGYLGTSPQARFPMHKSILGWCDQCCSMPGCAYACREPSRGVGAHIWLWCHKAAACRGLSLHTSQPPVRRNSTVGLVHHTHWPQPGVIMSCIYGAHVVKVAVVNQRATDLMDTSQPPWHTYHKLWTT